MAEQVFQPSLTPTEELRIKLVKAYAFLLPVMNLYRVTFQLDLFQGQIV